MVKFPNADADDMPVSLDNEIFRGLGKGVVLTDQLKDVICQIIELAAIRCQESESERKVAAKRGQRIVDAAEELRNAIANSEPGDLTINFQFRDAPIVAEYLYGELKRAVPTVSVPSDQKNRKYWVVHLIYSLGVVFSEAGGKVDFNDRYGNQPFAIFVRKVQTALPKGVKARPGRADEDYLWSTAWNNRNELKAKFEPDLLSAEGLQFRLAHKAYKERKENLIRALGGEVPSRPTPPQLKAF